MRNTIRQGDILTIENIGFPILTVSKDFFNQSDEIIGCPIMENTSPGPLHIRISTEHVNGYVLCEQVRLLDLRVRGYRKISELNWNDKMNISDAIQSIFEYI